MWSAEHVDFTWPRACCLESSIDARESPADAAVCPEGGFWVVGAWFFDSSQNSLWLFVTQAMNQRLSNYRRRALANGAVAEEHNMDSHEVVTRVGNKPHFVDAAIVNIDGANHGDLHRKDETCNRHARIRRLEERCHTTLGDCRTAFCVVGHQQRFERAAQSEVGEFFKSRSF